MDAASRRVQVRGSTAALQRVFGTELAQVESPDPVQGRAVTHRQRSGELAVPASLADVVVVVLGLDDRPQARTRFRPAATVDTSFTPLELGRVYRFPAGTDGSGQTLAILELGGGYTQDDLDTYWRRIGLTDPPTVTAVGVDGAANAPEGNPNGADGEVLLDIEVAGALAPGADVVVYFAPNTDRGFLDALATAVHADPTPAAVSISWGQDEDEWTAQARTAMDDAMADAAALGVTVCAAAGGGVSAVFPVPEWQAGVDVPGDADTGLPGRGVPDVSADADPATGYQVRVDGTDAVIGGTSAVSPLWSALVCRLAEALGQRPGLLQPVLYAGLSAGEVPAGFRDVTAGRNGAYQAGAGWDPCTGLGVPDGEALLVALRSALT